MMLKKNTVQEFELILDRFSNSIKAHILRYGLDKNGIDPDDVFQDVKIKIWKKIADEKKISNMSSYIRRVVNSTLIDHLRKSGREKKIIQYEKTQKFMNEKNYEDDLSRDEIYKEIVREAADSLLESRRKVVKLFLLDFSIEEIAASLNWSHDKTRNLLYRGLADLKKALKEKGVDYENRPS